MYIIMLFKEKRILLLIKELINTRYCGKIFVSHRKYLLTFDIIHWEFQSFCPPTYARQISNIVHIPRSFSPCSTRKSGQIKQGGDIFVGYDRTKHNFWVITINNVYWWVKAKMIYGREATWGVQRGGFWRWNYTAPYRPRSYTWPYRPPP